METKLKEISETSEELTSSQDGSIVLKKRRQSLRRKKRPINKVSSIQIVDSKKLNQGKRTSMLMECR